MVGGVLIDRNTERSAPTAVAVGTPDRARVADRAHRLGLRILRQTDDRLQPVRIPDRRHEDSRTLPTWRSRRIRHTPWIEMGEDGDVCPRRSP